jgi:chromosome segregation ATPase
LVDLEESSADGAVSVAVPAVPAVTQAPAKLVTPQVHAAAVAPEPDHAVLELLRRKVEESGTQRILASLEETAESLREFIPDPRSRYRAALKQLVKAGHAKDEVLGAYAAALQVIDAQTAAFAETTADARCEVNDMAAKLTALAEQRRDLEGRYDAKKAKLDEAVGKFGAAVESLRADMTASMAAMRGYLEE